MKNPIKNGKEVFAVLSMATVMSISMSVKVDAASNAANNEDTKNIVIEAAQNMDRSSTTNDGVDNSGSKEATAEDTKAIDPGSSEVGDNPAAKAGEGPALEFSEGNKVEAVRSAGGEVGKLASDQKEDENKEASNKNEVEEAQPKAPQPLTDEEAEKLKAAAKRVRPGAESVVVDPTTGWITVKTKVKEKQGDKEVEKEKVETINPYTPAGDEALITDYDASERYKETDLTPGSTIVENGITDEGKEKDGFKFDTLNPSAGSPDKKAYGYEIVIDKKTGQRTYTKIFVTDSGRSPVNTGDKPMMGEGEKLTPDSPEVTYKPDEDGGISGKRQKLYNYEASEETLKHINSKDNSSTAIGMKDNYTEDNPGIKYFGDSFGITYKVNPWPNENDKLQLMKLNGEYNEKVFVQGQDIDTKVKVDNIDANAKDRLVGQVYNPITGDIVPGASAYIGDDGNIHIKMPEGALKKNADGKYVVNEDSIFNTPDYKGIQNLDVKFFARPRTEAEFKRVAASGEDGYGNPVEGTYTQTGAGQATINHKGKDVVIDKQGIDRYDHYNLIGKLKINLDDTRYYDQKFVDKEGNDTEEGTSIGVQPGEPFTVKMDKPEGSGDSYKTDAEMNAAEGRGEAAGKLIMDFINRENKGKAEADQWKVKINPKDIASFTITAPESAKAGDFIAIPVEYTYTNGSKDTKWFHFVVQESDNNIPTYESEAGIAGKELKKTPELSQTEKDLKKLQPKSYKLTKTEYKDDKGNVWNVTIDETTGEVKATVPDDAKIPEGGAKLNVEVEVSYEEEVVVNGHPEKRTYTEKTKAQFYSIPSTRQEVKKEYETKLPFETKLIYDDKIPAGKVVEEGGVVGKQKMVFSQIVVGDKKGALDENGNFVEGKEAVTTEVVEKAQDKIIKIGTKPAETTVEIPKGLDYELDYSKKDGEPEIVDEGNDGVVTIKTTRDPQTGEITVTKTTTTEAKNKKIKIPAGTEGTHEYTEKKPFTYDVQFDPDFYKNYPDAKDNYKIVTEGKVGEKTTKWTIKNSEIVGEPEIIKNTDPTNAVIKVGQKDYTGTITHTESHEVPFEVEYKYSNELEAGQTKVEQKGEKGSYDVEYSQKIKNGEKDGELTSTKKNEKAAKKEIIVIGTKPVTKVVEKPFNTEYVYDENLESGKTEEVTPGKNGKVTITTSYDKDQKKVVTSETEEAGQNRVVKIGGKTNGTEKVKEEIPFEVEVRKDPSLKKGEWKYAIDDEGNELKGEKGEQEKTLTIVNSKVTETSEPTVTKKAKNAVVLVGEGTNDGTHEIKEKKELPFETKIEYDENLEAGQRQETGGEPGEQERTNILVIKDGKVTETKEGEFKTTKDPVDKVIKIGIKPVVKEVEKPFETEYIYDENVEMGKEEEVTPGEKGKVTITTSYDKDQNKLVTKEETKDPVKRVVKVGTKPVTKVVEKPFNTEYQYDENLEAGKTEEVTPGKNGKVTITTSYDETQKKIVTSETEEAGQNRVVKIGGKTKGTIEILDKLAYEVEVIKDDTMDAGTFKTVQNGIDGEKKTTLTIENSKEIKDSRKEEITKQPVKKIIKVGTKPNDKMCPVPENPSTPNDQKPNGPKEEEPGKPNNPGRPGENPNTPSSPKTSNTPGDKTSSEPGKNTPNKPGENPSVDPKNPPQEAPEKPKLEKENELKLSETEKVKEAEKAKEADEEIETEEAKVLNQVKKEEDEEASRVGNEAGKANLAGDDKAPKTGDAGLMAETASAGLASGLLLLLGRFKRKKEDEE